jgi:FeS assembly SUF system regulator
MIKLSKLTDYAVVLLVQIARRGDALSTTSILSQETGLPHPTVSKVLKILAKRGLLHAQRGSMGGYVLAREVGEITMATIITVMDGPIHVTECAQSGNHACDKENKCPINGRWNRVNTVLRTALESVTLQEMVQDAPMPLSHFDNAAE